MCWWAARGEDPGNVAGRGTITTTAWAVEHSCWWGQQQTRAVCDCCCLCAAFGKALENYFIPGLIALGLVCGGTAAKFYNDDATAFLTP